MPIPVDPVTLATLGTLALKLAEKALPIAQEFLGNEHLDRVERDALMARMKARMSDEFHEELKAALATR